MIVVSARRQTRTRNFDRMDRLKKPLAPFLRKLDFSDLLSGVDDERIWHAKFHLVFDKGAICESLNQVIGIDSAAAGGLLEFFNSPGTVPSAARTRQSGLPEMPRASERNGSPKKGWPGRSW